MTHWILLIFAALTSFMIARYQFFYLGRLSTFYEDLIVGAVLYVTFVLIFNKYFTKGTTAEDKNKIIEAENTAVTNAEMINNGTN